ncbi:MAG: redoxin domain-containing protein [Oscillospiraceae bacterium]|nr:redoxin domain-containing protein [Oscillospiraceae bacterium]
MKEILCMLLALTMLFGLCACGQKPAAETGNVAPVEPANEAVEEAADVEYRVLVTDSEGNAIPGVKVQFCDDSTCTMGDTDDGGAAVFSAKEGSYTVHVLQVPFGFIQTDEEFPFPDAGREVSIALQPLAAAIDDSEIGFAFYNPEKYEELKGYIDWYSYQISDGIYLLDPIYFASAKDDSLSLEERLQEAANNNSFGFPFEVFCVQKDASEAEAYLKENIRPQGSWEDYSLEVAGSAENLTCFLIQVQIPESNLELLKTGMGELYDEFMALREDKETFLSGIRLKKPVLPTLIFEALDQNGNLVNTADVFAGHKVTMVNIWETGCQPCKDEMPELEKLNREFEEQGCQIIGVCMFTTADDAPKVNGILDAAGVTYLNLIAPQSHKKFSEVRAFPTTYFVDSEGVILLAPFEGAPQAAYIYVYSDLLKDALSRLAE